MKIAVYPGSFNPFHNGHLNVVSKSITLFDRVIISIGINPEKSEKKTDIIKLCNSIREEIYGDSVEINYNKENEKQGIIKKWNNATIEIVEFKGLLKDHIKKCKANVIIKGIRDTNDMLYEQKQQYWNEDLGITIPTVYIISDRKLVHVSSSAIRALNKFKKE